MVSAFKQGVPAQLKAACMAERIHRACTPAARRLVSRRQFSIIPPLRGLPVLCHREPAAPWVSEQSVSLNFSGSAPSAPSPMRRLHTWREAVCEGRSSACSGVATQFGLHFVDRCLSGSCAWSVAAQALELW